MDCPVYLRLRCAQSLSRVRLFATPWTAARQAPLTMGILEWLPCPPSGDLPNPGIKPRSPTLQVDSLPSEPPGKSISGSRQHAFTKSASQHDSAQAV